MSDYQDKRPIPVEAKYRVLLALNKATVALSEDHIHTAAAEAAKAQRILMRMIQIKAEGE